MWKWANGEFRTQAALEEAILDVVTDYGAQGFEEHPEAIGPNGRRYRISISIGLERTDDGD